MIPYTDEALELFHKGTAALAQVEANGIRIDTQYLDKTIRRIGRKIKYKEEELQESEVVKIWKKKYRRKYNFTSNDQLGDILFGEMGFDCPATTKTGKFKTDEASISTVDHPFVKTYLRMKKLQKALSTNLVGLKKEVVDGFIHPFFNLHTVKTFRSSSEAINFQNQPVRDDEIMKIVRSAFIPRDGNRIVESDYGGIEVKTAACYHKDPNMLEYINDETKDMHRDMAMECYRLEQDQVSSKIRYCGKNQFVFPQFYGDYYIDCANHLWESVTQLGLKLNDGTPLGEHLRSQGFFELGTLDPRDTPRPGSFEEHIQKVEKNFWEVRFPVYARWKRDWYEAYKQRGWFQSLTGFVYQGYLKRNKVINYPVQGSAFHCLLWALIELMKELKKQKMKSLIVGQIHDSIVGDIPDEEFVDYQAMVQEIMVDRLKKAWKWIIVPLDVDIEATPVDGNWSQKKKVKIAA